MDTKYDVSSLLERLVLLLGCQDILDLHLVRYQAAINHVLGDIDPNEYSLDTWVKAALYIFPIDVISPFSCSEDVCFYIYDKSIEYSKHFFKIK